MLSLMMTEESEQSLIMRSRIGGPHSGSLGLYLCDLSLGLLLKIGFTPTHLLYISEFHGTSMLLHPCVMRAGGKNLPKAAAPERRHLR